MVCHWGTVSSGWSVIRVLSHHGGLLLGCCLIRVVRHWGVVSSGWSVIGVLSHQGGLSLGCCLIRVVIKAVPHQGGL